MKKINSTVCFILIFLFLSMNSFSVTFKINQEKEYFEAPGFSLLIFHDFYPEGKQGGIEIIQQNERIAACGDLRLEPTPGQWDAKAEYGKRELDMENNTIRIKNTFQEIKLNYTVHVKSAGDVFIITVDLDKPLPSEWAGKLGFNFELYPQIYFGKTFYLDNFFGIFPRQANGPVQLNPFGNVEPLPIAGGHVLSIAPEDSLFRFTIESKKGILKLYDGRNTAQNGWFVVRTLIPAGVTQNAVEWIIKPHINRNMKKKPVLSHSQVGYHPDQVKQAIIELDPATEIFTTAELARISPDGSLKTIFSSVPVKWGDFLRYTYAVFDFTGVKESGMYVILYADEQTEPFKISADVYKTDVWQPTLETFFPVQMCHMTVRDRYRIWHGPCHLDDALQAPTSHEHFDGYRQGAGTETEYKPYDHIPGLNRGGWHDAGDYDLAAGSQASTTLTLVLAKEAFGIDTDQTTVNNGQRLVELHKPDNVPDIVQQIKHGVENLLSGYRIAGHCFPGIISNSINQYVHLGDAMTMTDNLIYNPSSDKNEVTAESNDNPDDRWVFTNKSTALEYQAAATLTAVSRALKGYEDELADECLKTAENVWQYEQTHEPVKHRSAYVPGNEEQQEILAAAELYITTGKNIYKKRLIELLPEIKEQVGRVGATVSRVLPLLRDKNFAHEIHSSMQEYSKELAERISQNPYGVPYRPRIWGIAWDIQSHAVNMYYLHKAYPELFDRENVLRVVNFILGCHPGSSTSFISGVGSRSLIPGYGTNRADWSYIPGGGASGTALIRPDFPEMKEPFPFLWQQAEYVMPGAASYIFCILAADDLLNGK
ncbi:glycoside hydrolase family 9 protein [candidate division KSB1 bacterium]|nr:glycoside hydrolase family 9 protein [candidate division KSB1 bacterium]